MQEWTQVAGVPGPSGRAAHYNTIGDAVFQQDHAPVHTASVTEWFEQHNIQIDKHPPYSPDLNPIEHVQVVLKQQLHKQRPDIFDIPGGPDAIRARLIEVLPKVWDSLPEQLFDNLYRNVPDRMAAVIYTKGGILGTEHVFQFNFVSHFVGGFVTIYRLCNLILQSTRVVVVV